MPEITRLNDIQEKFAVISTIPTETGWKVEIVAENTGNYKAKTIDPNLEHAYVRFIDRHFGAEIKNEVLAE